MIFSSRAPRPLSRNRKSFKPHWSCSKIAFVLLAIPFSLISLQRLDNHLFQFSSSSSASKAYFIPFLSQQRLSLLQGNSASVSLPPKHVFRQNTKPPLQPLQRMPSSKKGKHQNETREQMPKNDASKPRAPVKLTKIRNELEVITGLEAQSTTNPNGIAPPALPKTHAQASLLRNIRKQTNMSPRWPKYNHTQGMYLKTFGPAFSSILVSHKLKLVYIPVFKVATTSMLWNIANLERNQMILNASNRLSVGDLMQLLHTMDSEAWKNHTIYAMKAVEINQILDHPEYLKFGFVRNPYDRVVSAYVDKVIRPEIRSEEYQDQMYSLYGNDLTLRKKMNSTRPTFHEFMSAVKKVLSEPRVPTNDLRYKEAYETNGGRRDLHWRPQVELLHPDIIHVDFVGRFEHLERDTDVVVQWTKHNGGASLPSAQNRRLHSTDSWRKKELFKTFERDAALRNMFVSIYKEDFERFQYSKQVPASP